MLTQVTTLRPRLSIDAFNVDNDAQLEAFILLVTGRFEKECNRLFGRTEGATYEFPADQQEILPPRFPIESVTAWHLKSDEDTGWEAQSDVGYLIRRAGEVGCVISLKSPLGSSDEIARVTYTGGYVLPGTTPGDGQTALPDDLEQACVEQCAYLWQNRNRLGLAAVSMDGGSITGAPVSIVKPLDLLPNVKQLLSRYERFLP